MLKRHGWARVTLVIGMSLAPLFETNLELTLRLQEFGRIDFWLRPVVLGLLTLILINMFLPAPLQTSRGFRAARDGVAP